MRIGIACDHRGFEAKKRLLPVLKRLGHDIEDMGCDGSGSVDYPDFAVPVARKVAASEQEVGILLDGSGIGMCIAANKVKGVRAAPCHDYVTAQMSRRHNNANVLCLSADLLGDEQIDRMVRIWLETDFENGRHARRVEKINRYEEAPGAEPAP